MPAQNSYAGLLKGALGKFLKEALVYVKDPKKLSRLLEAVLTYAKKNKKAAKAFLNDIFVLREIASAWLAGEYTDISKKTLVLIVAVLIYFISPIDLIPDWLPGGFVDDAALIGWIIQLIASDIEKYKAWNKTRDN